jgi:hypothetical protein
VPLRYTEQQRQVQIYDYLVYVCGVEISAYTKSIEVVHTNRSGPGSATIVLANPFDQWILTEANLKAPAGIWNMGRGKYSERPKADIYKRKKNLSNRLIIKRKKPSNEKAVGATSPSQPAENMKEEIDPEATFKTRIEDFLQRYSFGPGSCIFSKMDTVKIFIRNPYDDPDTTDRWIPFFTGFVDAKPFTTNYITGESSVTLTCFDIRQAMQGMRISANPYSNTILANGSTDSSVSVQQPTADQVLSFTSDSAGFFKDFYPKPNAPTATGYTNVFADKPFVDAISMIITGLTGWVNGTVKDAVLEGSGVGEFSIGLIYRYMNKNNPDKGAKPKAVTDLSEWDNLCLFGFRRDFWTLQDCKEAGQDSFYDGKRHPFTGMLHWLLPGEKLLISDMITSTTDGANNVMSNPEWTDRLALITQMCNQVDYEFTVTGAGDIVFEFPMYDFNPEAFQEHPGVYQTQMHVMSDNISDESGEVIAGLEAVSTSPHQGNKEIDSDLNNPEVRQTGTSQKRVVVFSNVLASKYGAKIHSVSFTGINETALPQMAMIEFQKRLAEANKLSLNMVFRPYLRPNRPFKYAERNRLRMGKITTVSYSMPVLAEPTMSLTLGCVKVPIRKNGINVFQQITGSEAFPLSYNEVLPLNQLLEGGDKTRYKGNGDLSVSVLNPDTPRGDAVSTARSKK